MAYNYWKMMEKVGVAIDSRPSENWRGKENFNGYIFEAGDEKGQKAAEEWARSYDNRYDKDKETIVHEPNVHIFDNEGFSVTILDSAGGSSQGGRLSFWKCRVEKDGVSFIVGVNDAILADLIRHSDIKGGTVQQGVMFARRGGQPGFIHKDMEAYKEAMADTQKKAEMKTAKKTTKWEIGGVYSTLTKKSICIGELWDHYEEVTKNDSSWPYRRSTKLVKRERPVKVLAWMSYSEQYDGELGLTPFLKRHVENGWRWFSTGKPPARAKSEQLTVSEEDYKLIDTLLANREDYVGYGDPKVKGRYTRARGRRGKNE